MWPRCLFFSAAYFGCAEAARFLSARDIPDVSFWLPGGLYVAVLLLSGRRDWPWLALAAVPAHLAFDLLQGLTIGTALLLYAANTLQAVTGAGLVTRFTADRPKLGTLRDFVALLGLAAVFSPMLGGAVGAATLKESGLSPSFAGSWQVWWGSNAMAILLVSPFLLAWFSGPGANPARIGQPRILLEAALLVFVLTLLTVRLLTVSPGGFGPYKFTVLLPLLWAGLRFGPRGATGASLLVALLTFSLIRFLPGPDAEQVPPVENVFLIQAFLAVASLVALIPAIVLVERDRTTVELRKSEERFRFLTSAAFEGIGISENGRIVDANDQLLRLIGCERQDLVGREVLDLVAPESRAAVSEAVRLGREGTMEHRLLRQDGGSFVAETRTRVIQAGDHQVRITAIRDISERKQAEALSQTQRQVLEMIATGQPMEKTLDALVRMVEAQSTDMVGSILLLDPDGIHIRHGAAPSLPQDYWKAIDGAAIGPRAGSCGTAAFRGQAVFVEDIATDPLWEDYRHLALPHGLRACWSTPILDAGRNVLGTFALYYRQAGLPNERHRRLIDMATQSAAVCIAKHRSDQALRESEERYRTVVEFFPECVAVSVDDRLVYVNPAGARLVGAAGPDGPARLLGRLIFDFIPAGLHERIREQRRGVLERGVVGPVIQGSIVRPDGAPVIAEGQAIPFVYDGRPAVLTVVRDITERKRAEAALRESEEKFSKAFRSCPDAVALSEVEGGRYIDINEGFERLFGFSRDEVIGRTAFELGVYHDPNDRGRLIEELRASGLVRDVELRCVRRPGEALTCLYGGEIVELGGRLCVVSVIHDITDRVKAEEALRENQRVLSTLLSNLPGMVYRCRNDRDWTMEFASEGCRELTGYAPEDLVGNRRTSYGRIIHRDDERLVFAAVQTALGEREPFELTYRIRTAGGAEKWVWERGRGIFSDQGELLALEGFVTDITGRRRAELERAEALGRERRAHAEFTRLLIASQETERRRIAGELHDSLGQNLLLIKNRAHLALTGRAPDPGARSQLEGIEELSAQAIAEVRQISQNLHPYQLSQLGLTRALEAMIDNAAQSSAIRFERKLEPVDEVFRTETATHVYRVVQEALNNTLKHSRARRARILLERDVREVRLWIEDDGRGFDAGDLPEETSAPGFGLKNIAERVRILGGSLKVDSRPGAGTRLEVILPAGAEAG